MPVEVVSVKLYGLIVTVHEQVSANTEIYDENGVYYGLSRIPDNRRWMLGEGKFALGYFRNKSEADNICDLLNQPDRLYESGMVTVEVVEYDISVLDLYPDKEVEAEKFYGEGCLNTYSKLIFNYQDALNFLANQ